MRRWFTPLPPPLPFSMHQPPFYASSSLPITHPPFPMPQPPFSCFTLPSPYLTLLLHASISLPIPHPPLPCLPIPHPPFPCFTLPSHASPSPSHASPSPSHASTCLPMSQPAFPCLSQATCFSCLCSHSYFLKPLVLTF